MIKKIIVVASMLVAIGLAFLFPSKISDKGIVEAVSLKNDGSALVPQKIEAISIKPVKVTKLYYKSDFLGVMSDISKLDDLLVKAYQNLYQEDFPDYDLNLSDDIYFISYDSFWLYENKDEEICNYIYDNNLFEVKALKIEIIGDNEKLKDTIYVRNQDDFTNALKRFAMNFTDEETYTKLENNEVIAQLDDYGTRDMKLYLQDTIKATPASATAQEIITSEDEIYEYLCYGRNTKKKYYSVSEYETIERVADKYQMTAQQLVQINEDLTDINQALYTGQELLVTYYKPSVTIVLEQQRLAKEITYPSNSIYELNLDVPVGTIVTIDQPSQGYDDVLYTDIYVNGINASYRQEYRNTVVEPVTGYYHVGSAGLKDTGDLLFIWPIDNPRLTCSMQCYEGHHGIDMVNRYDKNFRIYAIEDGVVTSAGFSESMGNYCRINHGNGYIATYCHFAIPAYVVKGDIVSKGQLIGKMGNTGDSNGIHLHLRLDQYGQLIDPCTIYPCNTIR